MMDVDNVADEVADMEVDKNSQISYNSYKSENSQRIENSQRSETSFKSDLKQKLMMFHLWRCFYI